MSLRWPNSIVNKTFTTPTGAQSTPGLWKLNTVAEYVQQALWPQPPTYIEDVFSTYLYTGNGSTQTINNGIDLAGKGGMVWLKCRSNAGYNILYDTARGAVTNNAPYLVTDLTNAQSTYAQDVAMNVTSSGFTLGDNYPSNINVNGYTEVSWTFRKAPKFFDVVTYTGDGTTDRNIAHSLGVQPGMIFIKPTSTSGNWSAAAKAGSQYYIGGGGSGSGYELALNTTDGYYDNPALAVVADTTNFKPDRVYYNGSSVTNASGVSYVAYLFAHDTSTNGLIQCGSFTTNSGGDATVTLGWEPQYILRRLANGADNWTVVDSMRGMALTQNAWLVPNSSNAETSSTTPYLAPTSTGFTASSSGASKTYIYMAIRRGPMKTPTNGTTVFSPVTRTGTGGTTSISGLSSLPDVLLAASRDGWSSPVFFDRLRGFGQSLITASTSAEGSATNSVTSMNNTSIGLGADSTQGYVNYSSKPYVNWILSRAPGFFDVVCYTGTGVARDINHNLGVAPELMIFKSRTDTAYGWITWHSGIPITSYVRLNNGDIPGDLSAFPTWWLNSTYPTKSTLTLGESVAPNNSGQNYVAYLFASCPGVSKVGSYTGTGSTQTISCGFTGGARFVLIKRTDSTGGWMTYDTARGMVAGTDPYLQLNTTAAEVNQNDVYTTTGGFQLVSSNTGTNANGGSYIFLAIA